MRHCAHPWPGSRRLVRHQPANPKDPCLCLTYHRLHLYGHWMCRPVRCLYQPLRWMYLLRYCPHLPFHCQARGCFQTLRWSPDCQTASSALPYCFALRPMDWQKVGMRCSGCFVSCCSRRFAVNCQPLTPTRQSPAPQTHYWLPTTHSWCQTRWQT